MHHIGLPVDRLPDETLLAGLAAGDDDAALAFVRRFQRKVYGIAVAVVRDPGLAEDVAQRTFERAWQHAQMYDPRRGSASAWLGTIAHHLAIDAVRVRRPSPLDPDDVATFTAAVTTGPEDHALSSQAADGLRSALATLPSAQARAVVMAGICGLTAQEVAEREGIPLGTAKTRIRAAMIRLRTTLAGEEVDHG